MSLTQLVNQGVHLLTQARIQIGKGFVQQQQRPFLAKTAGQGGSLALAARHLSWPAPADITQLRCRKGLVNGFMICRGEV